MSALEKQSILIVDDEANNRTVLMEMFKNHYKVILAKSGEMALELAQKHAPDLILLDVLMAGMSGYETLEQLKAKDVTREIPVVFITALDGSVDEEKGLLLGAVDYITKPFHPAIVRARVKNHLRWVRQKQLLERFAMFDPLTELPNRRRLDRLLAADYEPGKKISIAMIDIDFFKKINDVHGHSFGDRVLQLVSDVFRETIAASGGQIARYGGEEFVAWLPESSREMAEQICERIRATVQSLEIDHLTGVIRVTVSIGGATSMIDENGKLPSNIVDRADQAVYEAKSRGRNCVVWDVI
jgi:diguanylate cyclase (GGDEF)-like protein